MTSNTPRGSRGDASFTDDVAENIRTQQQADAMPTSEDVDAHRRQTEAFHAELKAVQAFLDALNERDHVDVAFAIAEHCGFERFEQKAGSRIRRWHQGQRRWKEFKRGHLEAHEHPGSPDEFERQVPPAAHHPPFPVTDRVRSLKAEAWLKLPNPDETEISKERLDAGGAVRYRVMIDSPLGETTTQLIEERE